MRELADDHDTAIGVVLHDLGHAAAVADHVILLDAGRARAVGTCEEVFTAEMLTEVYGLPITVTTDEDTGLVRVEALPRRRRRPTAPRSQRSSAQPTAVTTAP